MLQRAGTFAFAVAPGTYRLAAFADRQDNLIYDPGEPALAGQAPFEISAGETRDDIELVIPHDASFDQSIDIRAVQARTPNDQESFSLGRFTVRGEVVDLNDPKFGEANGSMGMWRFVDFIFEVGPGVYFLEKYDPKKIPVLYVHGISGYPQQFTDLIAALDREHFQPWFYFYPSGFHLDGIAAHLSSVIGELQARLGFDELAVVAHSMGGLVSRSFILKHYEQTGREDTRLFVAISSPWGGSEGAENIGRAPNGIVVFSWLDMNPSSDFLKGLFHLAARLPERAAAPGPHRVPHDLRLQPALAILGPVRRPRAERRQRWRAPRRSTRPAPSCPSTPRTTGILQSEAAIARVNALLAEVFEGAEAAR